MTTLTLKWQPEAPLEGGVIAPDTLMGKSATAIGALSVMHGNEEAPLRDFFEIDGEGTSDIILNGDLSHVKNIGARMRRGRVTINGDAGMHLGAWMQGGEVQVSGDAGDWAGAEMTGGKIHICGNAGHGLGGAYRGSRYGMNRGLIIVGGSAGNEVGALMRRGLIVVLGDAGDFTGAFMTSGSIVIFGKMGIRAGAGLLRGSIIAFHDPELLPSFRFDCRYQPDFVRVILRELRLHGVQVSNSQADGFFRRYSGDLNRIGKGEILVYDQH
jgi:formylmethanofuran dehydrogenase subunit C